MKPTEYVLKNAKIEVGILDYGVIISKIIVKDFHGEPVDVVLGYDDTEEYLTDTAAFGATIGRFADRIRDGKFSLNGKEYQLACNNGRHHIHGGPCNFSKHFWSVRQDSQEALTAARFSPDGEEGYPGNMEVQVHFSIENESLIVSYEAVCDQDTICNLTNHTYFNLRGKGDILNHQLQVKASFFCPIDSNGIPLDVQPVADTVFDFRNPAPLGRFQNVSDPQVTYIGTGYNHFYVVDGSGLRRAATLYCPETKIEMTVDTTSEGFQLYTANVLNVKGKHGRWYCDHDAVCIETETAPNAVNQPVKRHAVLKAGTHYRETTIFSFRRIETR